MQRSGLFLGLILILGFVASLAANWPGHFPPDAVWQLAQGRAGVYNLWHPPVMAWVLGVADRIWPGASLFVALDTAVFFIALGAFTTLRGRIGAIGLIAPAIIAALPLVLIYQGLVLKDVLFADASAAGFAALAWAGRCWDRRGVRWALAGLSLALFTLAALTRQNGAIIAVAGAGALSAMTGLKAAKMRSGRAALAGLAALTCMGAAAAVVSIALAARSDHKPSTALQVNTVRLYDLAGAIRRRPELALPSLKKAPDLARYLRQTAAPAWDPTRVDTLVRTDEWEGFMKGAGPATGAAWHELIATAPGLYLRIRAEVFGWALATPRLGKCAPIIVGVDSQDSVLLEEADLAERYNDKDDWDTSYSRAFEGTPLYSHLFYGALAAGLLVWAARDLRRGGGPELIAVIAMLASALAFTASFFFIALACDYRYLYFLDVAAMAGVMHRVGPWGFRNDGRRKLPLPPVGEVSAKPGMGAPA